MFLLRLFILLGIVSCVQGQKLKLVPASDQHLYINGRFTKAYGDGIRYALPGVSVYCSFEGTSLDVVVRELGDGGPSTTNYLAVLIDERQPVIIKLNKTDTIYTVARRLDKKQHNLRIVKRTESSVGELIFKGIMIDQNARIEKYNGLPALKFLFIGNSITCGYGNDTSIVSNPGTGFTSKHENNYNSFGQITARTLNAQYAAFAYSGRGLYKNYDGSTENTIPAMFDQIIPGNTDLLWDHSKYNPDVIFINLGTNDFSSETNGHGEIDSTTFVTRYLSFITKIKNVHHDANIVLQIGTLMGDEYPVGKKQLTRIRSYVQAVVNYEKQRDNKKIYFIELAPQQAPYGEDWHPSLATHQKMAAELTGFVKDNVLK